MITRYVTYNEFIEARKSDPNSSQQAVLMRLFEQKGIRLKNDSYEAVPPVEIRDDEKNSRFVVRQWGEKK